MKAEPRPDAPDPAAAPADGAAVGAADGAAPRRPEHRPEGRVQVLATAVAAGLRLRDGVLSAGVRIHGSPTAPKIEIICRVHPSRDPLAVIAVIDDVLVPRLERDSGLTFTERRLTIHATAPTEWSSR